MKTQFGFNDLLNVPAHFGEQVEDPVRVLLRDCAGEPHQLVVVSFVIHPFLLLA